MLERDLARVWATKKLLYHLIDRYSPDIAVSCSFGAPEGMVILDMLKNISSEFRICTIDTGRLPQATYNLMDKIREKYNYKFDIIYPEYTMLQELVEDKGMNCFYESVENRKECCYIRKVAPFNAYLKTKGIRAIVGGLRQEQSAERSNTQMIELDKYENCAKINPIFDWTKEEVMTYIDNHGVPINQLHKEGYESVGCEPCSRPGEGRSGRWWWEHEDVPKECGLHDQGSGI
jgi:phosphoadenosine phosphosulfate reductase